MTTKSRLLRSIGATLNQSERERDDYYATEPKAVELLLDLEKFDSNILEPCCGEGHMSEVLKSAGYNVTSSDLIDRGYGEVKSLFDYEHFDGDVITNPPYKLALDCVKKSLDIVDNGRKVAMFLKIRQDVSSLNSARQRFYMWLVADLCVQRMVILSSTRAQQCHFAGLSGKKATKAIQSLNGSTNKNTHLNRGGYFVLQ